MEVVPGLWPTGATDRTVFVVNTGVVDTAVTKGEVVGVDGPVRAQTRTCKDCGAEDTDAWEYHRDDSEGPSCATCKTPYPGGPSACRECGSGRVAVLGYAGCSVCCPDTPKETYDVASDDGEQEEDAPQHITAGRRTYVRQSACDDSYIAIPPPAATPSIG